MSCRVSVIIPVYNCIKFLDKAVKSVIAQTDFELLELILVDDGSSDGSAELCDDFSKQNANISVLHQENSGVSVARNNGIERAKGEYIAFLDSDDEYSSGFIHEMLAESEYDLVCCDYFNKSKDEKHLGTIFEDKAYFRKNFDLDFCKKIIREEFYSCWNKLYKKEIINQNNIRFAHDVKYGEDMEFVFEYLRHCDSFRFIDRPLYHYNINPYNTTSVVKNGFDVQHSIYVFQNEYFSSTNFKDEISAEVLNKYIFNTTCTVNSEITYGTFFGSYKYVKRVLASDFYELYLKANYSEFKCFYDRVFFTLLKKRMALGVVILRKLFDLRSRLLHD